MVLTESENQTETETETETNIETQTLSESQTKIITQILTKLDGFTTDSTDLNANKVVTNEEIIEIYTTATYQAQSYTRLTTLPENDARFIDGICTWSAGLLYKKYDERPNDQIDETVPIGVGDQLIISAKSLLKPYKYYEFHMG